MTRALAGLAISLALTLPSAASAAPPIAGTLTQLPGVGGCTTNGTNLPSCADGYGLAGADDIAVSPDGKNLYVSGSSGYVAVFSRDAASGAFSEIQCYSNDGNDPQGGGSCVDGRGISDPQNVVISPDGNFVYTGSLQGNGEIAIFQRDPSTGTLTQLPGKAGCFSNDGSASTEGPDSCDQGRGFSASEQMAMSPDGKQLYVADDNGAGGVAVLNRDLATGELSQSAGLDGCVSDDGTANPSGSCANLRALGDSFSLAVSPDGHQLYVAGDLDQMAVLQRDPTTGALTQSSGSDGCLSQSGDPTGGPAGSCTNVFALNGVQKVYVSPDGRSVYAPSPGDYEVPIFSRDPATGALTQPPGAAGCVSDDGHASDDPAPITGGCTDVRGLIGAFGMGFSPGGDTAYVTGEGGPTIAVFARDAASSGLTQLAGKAGCLSSTGDDPSGASGNGLCTEVGDMSIAEAITVSGDGAFAYYADSGDPAVLGFRREAAPTCQDSAFTVPHATATPLTLPCSDANGDPVSISIASAPSSGSLGPASGAGVTYTPAASFSGPDSFTYRASDGTNSSQAATATLQVGAGAVIDRTAPVVGRLRLTRSVFRVGRARTPLAAAKHGSGTTLTFTLSEPARVAIAIQRALPGRRVGHACRRPSARLRHRRACVRYVTAGTLRRSGKQGRDRVKFSGRLGRRALKLGRYRARLVATDPSGNRSKARTVKFRVVRH